MVKVVIAEDDLASRKVLGHFLKGLPNYTVIGEATNGEELIRLIVTEKPDLALVDIDMPRLNGMEAIKSCKELIPSLHVIFITGHDDFAIDAFNLSATDYILKPVERERLYSALKKVSNTSAVLEEKRIHVKQLTVKEQNNLRFIPFEDIIFIEKIERKTNIHTLKAVYETNEPLSEYEKLLDSRFMASHRSYIINLDHITKIKTHGQMYTAYFRSYHETAKISKHRISEIQELKSNTKTIIGKRTN